MQGQPPTYDSAQQQPGYPQGQPMMQPTMMYDQNGQPMMYAQQQPGYPQGQPMYVQPMGQPYGQPTVVHTSPTVVHAAPSGAVTQTVVVNSDNGEQDLLPAILIFVLGWVCLCCIWLGGIAYLKSKNPTARILAIASLVMYGIGSVVVIIVIIVESIAAAKVANDVQNYYYYYYNYYNYYNYYCTQYNYYYGYYYYSYC